MKLQSNKHDEIAREIEKIDRRIEWLETGGLHEEGGSAVAVLYRDSLLDHRSALKDEL